jgi:alpha-D-ribose 1-methylphosphonate 5-triphosphate synthase subunit PhnG
VTVIDQCHFALCTHQIELKMSVESSSKIEARRKAMACFARATRDELQVPIERRWPGLEIVDLKPVETGLVMLRGRMGGEGAPFNLGEATVSRAVVQLADDKRGYGHVLGRDRGRARLAAIADALWQQDEAQALVEADIVAPVAARLAAEKAETRARSAATKVDFFTLVRGED